MKTSGCIIALCLAFQVAKTQVTVTLQASQDAAIGFHDGANTAGNNYGGAIQNAAYMIPAYADPNGYNGNRALLAFNLSSLPANAVLISAHLNLYALGPAGSLPGHVGTANASYLQRITQSWGEYTATWNNQPASVTQNQVTLPQSTSATQDYVNINVTTLVQDMLNNPASSFGFLLRLVNEVSSNGLLFGSRDHSNPALRPSLVIVYRPCSQSVPVTISGAPDRTLCAGTSVQMTASGAASYTWSGGQQTALTGSVVVLAPQITTVYTVNATDNNGCAGSSQVTLHVTDCNGIETLTDEHKWSVYPNPSAGSFLVSLQSAALDADEIHITDLQGRLIVKYTFEKNTRSCEIQNSGLDPGIYFCKLVSNGACVAVRKIVIR